MSSGCSKNTCIKRPGPEIHVPIIWVLGGPCSGKGTQCERIANKYSFIHLSTGDLLREEVAKATAKGKQLDATMKRGELVSNNDVLSLLKNATIEKTPQAKGFLIDGYPREKSQGEEFQAIIGKVTLILYFEVSDETMLSRLLKRAETSNRTDDNAETLSKRIETFKNQRDLILEQYADKVTKIDGERTVEDIFADVEVHLDPLATQVQQAKI